MTKQVLLSHFEKFISLKDNIINKTKTFGDNDSNESTCSTDDKIEQKNDYISIQIDFELINFDTNNKFIGFQLVRYRAKQQINTIKFSEIREKMNVLEEVWKQLLNLSKK